MDSGEQQRRAYLDAMGIDIWLPRDADEAVGGPSGPIEHVGDSNAEGTSVANQIGPEGPPANNADWDELRACVAGCTRCELAQSRSNTVFGVGNTQADWMIIGEAPGRDEDLQGEPFVGRAGQLLNAMLAAIGFQRSQVYIANILKCRPPNNRDPGAEEAAACNSWLQQQIELIQPRVILALGRVAAHNLLNTEKSLGALRTRQHSYAGIPLIVTYHPAYLLRKPIDKRKSWQDLKRARLLLNSYGRST